MVFKSDDDEIQYLDSVIKFCNDALDKSLGDIQKIRTSDYNVFKFEFPGVFEVELKDFLARKK